MVVGRGVSIKMIHAVSHVQPVDFAAFSQERQIAVHSAKADVGILPADVLIDHIRGGMVLSRRQKIFD
jgi:hypothetical protein